jgi:hypothetical protein
VETPLEAVQAALDHSNLATTSIYLRLLEGLAETSSPQGEGQWTHAVDGVPSLAEELRRRRSALRWTVEQVAD